MHNIRVWRIIVRRGLVAAAIFAVFFFWVLKGASARDVVLALSGLLFAGAVAGLVLSWPRSRLVRALEVALFVGLIGFRGQPFELSNPTRSIVTALITGVPVLILLAVVLAVDIIVAALFRKLAPKVPAA